jgi:hypothetical protein
MEAREQGRPYDADGFRRALFDARHVERTRYDLTVAALDEAFAAGQVHYEFYEALFDQAAIDRLCRFLGVEPRPANFDARINVDDRRRPLGRDEHAMGLDCFAPVYEFCRRRFAGQVPGSWGRPADEAA